MSICKFKFFSGGYTSGPPFTGKGKGEEKGKEGKGEGMGRRRRRVGDEGYRTERRGGMG
jgi:hypothetical protein